MKIGLILVLVMAMSLLTACGEPSERYYKEGDRVVHERKRTVVDKVYYDPAASAKSTQSPPPFQVNVRVTNEISMDCHLEEVNGQTVRLCP
jgi:hypothetical protein